LKQQVRVGQTARLSSLNEIRTSWLLVASPPVPRSVWQRKLATGLNRIGSELWKKWDSQGQL